MVDNNNPRISSAKESMMAEMIITEIDKLAEYHKKVLESNQLLEAKYQQVESLLNEQKQTINAFASYVKDNNEFIRKYATLTRTAVDLSESLVAIQKKGIGISEEGRKKITDTLTKVNEPIWQYMKYLLYAIGLAFLLLFIVAIFI